MLLAAWQKLVVEGRRVAVGVYRRGEPYQLSRGLRDVSHIPMFSGVANGSICRAGGLV